ncbi:MAG: phage portal protein [Clostridia bacterium]|nr:phage portal protein [Clostridia bacterium]
MVNDSRLLQDVKAAFPDIKLPDLDVFYADVIYNCRDIFSGSPAWRQVKRSGLYGRGLREMAVLNSAKVLCDEFSALTFTEKTEIKISDDTIQKFVDGVLKDNGFYENMPQFLSYAYALGGGVIKCFADNGSVMLDYLHADQFVPTEYDSRRIYGGVFRSVTCTKGTYYTLLENYSRGSVQYKLYRSADRNTLGAEVSVTELYELPENVAYDTDVPMFAYFRPAVSNNLGDNCLGLSVFANSTGTLKALDVAFDSFSREFILGRKRIIVPSSCIRTVVDTETGTVKRYFDADDEVFQALRCDDDKDLHITDNTMEIRVAEHVDSINALLNILCFQTGLSAGALSFDASGGMKTATEVISQNSKTYRTAKAHKNMLEEFLADLVHSICAVGNYLGQCPELTDSVEISVTFADNIIEDDNTIIDNNIKLVNAGLKSKLTAIMEVLKCDEDTAQKELDRINEENAAVTDSEMFDADRDSDAI